MKPILKTLLGQIRGLELWMTAIPLLKCIIEGHEPREEAEFVHAKSIHHRDCARCKLVYWEEA